MSVSLVKYPSLNGLRAISILFVILQHLQSQSGVFNTLALPKWLNPFLFTIQDGSLGVNIFFVISGFLISSLLLNEEKQTGTISLKSFYLRRTFRIFPAYYFFYLFIFFCKYWESSI